MLRKYQRAFQTGTIDYVAKRMISFRGPTC
jgi:hypothetical protein